VSTLEREARVAAMPTLGRQAPPDAREAAELAHRAEPVEWAAWTVPLEPVEPAEPVEPRERVDRAERLEALALEGRTEPTLRRTGAAKIVARATEV
jgi:hypothetical protein